MLCAVNHSHMTFNLGAVGSSPTGLTNEISDPDQ